MNYYQNIIMLHRGRIQAQGDGCEQSESWAQNDIPTKKDGDNYLQSLSQKLSKKQQKQRKKCFCSVRRFINQAPKNGYDDNVKPKFLPSPPYKDVRVDVEIIKGRAFKDGTE